LAKEFHRIERRRGEKPVTAVDKPGAEAGGSPDQSLVPVATPPLANATNGAAARNGGLATAAPPNRRAGRLLVGTEGERSIHSGERAGDRAVRIVRPRLEGVHVESPGFVVIEREPEPTGTFARSIRSVKRLLIGAPIKSDQEVHERLTKLKGLAVFASDNISSSAYATEEIMRVLVYTGIGSLALTMPLTIGLVVLLAIVSVSYQQTIRAYPNGGGSYIVASDNLGDIPGLIAGAALLVDYVLTVAVSISAGILAVTSLFPSLEPIRVWLCVGSIALITLGNLRGIRESGSIFAAPLYIYLVSIVSLLAYGLFRWATGTLPVYTPNPEWVRAFSAESGALPALSLFVILRAFSSGAVALTGVEAVSNGIPAFQRPETRNARITLVWMASLFAVIFLGMSFLAGQLHILPDPDEIESVVSQLTRTLVGSGWMWYVVQLSTTVLLVLAANTSFADFPRLASIMAKDKFLPSHFAFRGERLAFTNGIVLLSTVAALLVIGFGGSVTALIPLYTVGVFVAFTLSQTGMVKHSWKLRQRGWQTSMAVNATGALATGVVAIVVGVTKFALGAWVVMVLIPILVLILIGIRSHYQAAREQLMLREEDLRTRPDLDPEQIEHTVIIPVADITRATMRAIAYAESLTGKVSHSDDEGHANIVAVHVTDSMEAGEALKDRWDQVNPGIDLVIVESPYRALAGPLMTYINALERQRPEATSIVTVLLPEYMPAHWWEHILHTQTAFRLKAALLFRQRTAVISVPYHLSD
jgi:amino acid transporter